MTNLVPPADKLLATPVKRDNVTDSGIVLPEHPDHTPLVEVVAVGSTMCDTQVGTQLLILPHCYKFSFEGQEYYLANKDAIVAALDK